MPQTFYTKKGDTGIPLEVILKDAAGAIDLTDWTVKMIMTEHGKTERIIDEADAVIDPDQEANKGKIRYNWQSADVENIGQFDVEFVGTTPTGDRVSFPRQTGDEKFLIVMIIKSKA